MIVDALGHKTKFVAGVSAGCEKDGTRAHYECEVCGKLFDDAKAENEVSASALDVYKRQVYYRRQWIINRCG